nr:Spore coat protein like [Ipomoea batatas]
MHETSNCLEHRRLKDIVFLQSNLRLREQKNREQGPVDPISYENIELVKDWVSEKELCSEEPSSSDWMAVDPPLGNTVLFAPAVDDFEALGAGNHGFHYLKLTRGA